MLIYSKQKGFTIMEVVIAMGLFTMVASSIVIMVLGSHTATLRAEKSIEAVAIAQEGLEATKNLRDRSWANITTGAHGIDEVAGAWTFSGTSDSKDGYTRVVTISKSGDTASVDVDVDWEITSGVQNSITLSTKITNWR